MAIPIGTDLWPLPTLTVYAGWRSTDPDHLFLQLNHFAIAATAYPNTWEGCSAETGRRFFVHLARPADDAPFDFVLILYENDDPLQQLLWNAIAIDTRQPFNSRLLTRGPPDVAGIANLMITE